MLVDLEKSKSSGTTSGAVLSNSLPVAWAFSTVSTFGSRYNPPVELSTPHSVEALVEGSDMSQLREGVLFHESIGFTGFIIARR